MENNENTEDKTVFIKKTIKLGNSSGVLLPKSLLGSEVKIQVINKPLDIKKDTIEILEKYFSELIGIYLINKAEKEIEILAVSTKMKKIIHSGKYKINIVPLSLIKKDLKTQPRLKTKLNQAKLILNKKLLFELRKGLS